MFEKKDREIKELQSKVSMTETRVVKLEQIDEKLAHERKNTLIMVALYLLHHMQRTASPL